MGLKIIPNDISNLEPGEKRVANKLNSLYLNVDYDCYLYVQPRLKKLNPDFLLIDAYKGICVIEVKDWSIGYDMRDKKSKEYFTSQEYLVTTH